MRVQQSRTDVLPTTWEVPAAIASCWVLLALLALPVGQGAAFWVTGHGFAWPDGQVPGSILGLLTGHTSVGLRQLPGPSVPVSVVYTAIIMIELLLCGCMAWLLAWWWRALGPGAQHGLANTRQVAVVLGQGNLRKRWPVIRPDLQGASRQRSGAPW